jgi:hypothetical protein
MTSAALLVLALTALPEGSARYRFEIGGEPVGAAELTVRCAGGTCRGSFAVERRAPAEAGGERSSWRADLEVDREGRWRGGAVSVVEDGRSLGRPGAAGLVPASLAEVVLLAEAPLDGSEICVEVFEEERGAASRGRGCARRQGGVVIMTLLDATLLVVPAADGLPEVVEVAANDARFVRDAAAKTPAEPPRLHGAEVAGPADPAAAVSYCGTPRDPPAPLAELARVPAPRAEGASCREKTAAWLDRARAAGLEGRTAVGVAWDGARFVWHAWAEVLVPSIANGPSTPLQGEGAPNGLVWVAIDPSFEEAPARSPRFTVARYDPRDPAARRRAGAAILACWGKARVLSR